MMQFVSAYGSVADQFLIASLLAMSQYIVLRAGTFSVATPAFAAVGAYTTAILTVRVGVAAPLAIAAGLVLATLVGAAVAYPLSRLRGVFQAVASLALVQVVTTAALNWDSVTRGALGISGIPKVATTGWLLLAVAAAAFLLHRIGRSDIGRAMNVIREDETVAVSLGIRVAFHQRIAMILSSALAGLGGGLYACNAYAVSPGEFGFHMLVNVLAMVVLGGRTTVWGGLFGAAVLTLLPELFRGLAEYRDVAQGLLLIAAIVYLPNGVVDTLVGIAHDRRIARAARATAPSPRSAARAP